MAALLLFGVGGVIWWRPPVKYREWWNTEFSRTWEVTGRLAYIWARHFLPLPHPIAANDADHVRW